LACALILTFDASFNLHGRFTFNGAFIDMGEHHSQHAHIPKFGLAGLLVTLGIIYGDIGTSPLYVMKAIVGDRIISEELILILSLL
jgi:hypothetical protein